MSKLLFTYLCFAVATAGFAGGMILGMNIGSNDAIAAIHRQEATGCARHNGVFIETNSGHVCLRQDAILEAAP